MHRGLVVQLDWLPAPGGVFGAEQIVDGPAAAEVAGLSGIPVGPTATSTRPSPLMSRAAMHTSSCAVKSAAITNFFQSPLRYQTICRLSASRMSGFPSPSTSPIATPYPIATVLSIVWAVNLGGGGSAAQTQLARSRTNHDRAKNNLFMALISQAVKPHLLDGCRRRNPTVTVSSRRPPLWRDDHDVRDGGPAGRRFCLGPAPK